MRSDLSKRPNSPGTLLRSVAFCLKTEFGHVPIIQFSESGKGVQYENKGGYAGASFARLCRRSRGPGSLHHTHAIAMQWRYVFSKICLSLTGFHAVLIRMFMASIERWAHRVRV